MTSGKLARISGTVGKTYAYCAQIALVRLVSLPTEFELADAANNGQIYNYSIK